MSCVHKRYLIPLARNFTGNKRTSVDATKGSYRQTTQYDLTAQNEIESSVTLTIFLGRSEITSNQTGQQHSYASTPSQYEHARFTPAHYANANRLNSWSGWTYRKTVRWSRAWRIDFSPQGRHCTWSVARKWRISGIARPQLGSIVPPKISEKRWLKSITFLLLVSYYSIDVPMEFLSIENYCYSMLRHTNHKTINIAKFFYNFCFQLKADWGDSKCVKTKAFIF